MYLYLQLLCVFVVVPNIILLYVNRKKIHLKALCIALLVLFLIAVLWDQVSVRMGLWVFSINIYLLIEGFVTNNKKKMKVKKDE
jgi:hypothetical protein